MDERALGDVADDVARNVKQIAFPFEHRAEVLGEYKEQRAALRSIYSYMAAAAVLMFLLTQAVLRSWTLSALSLLGVPVAALGGLARPQSMTVTSRLVLCWVWRRCSH